MKLPSFLGRRAFTLAKTIVGIPDPLSQKMTPKLRRIAPEKLEAVYLESPVIFNTVNKIVQTIMSSSHHLEGDEHSVAFFQEFVDTIGKRGGENDWYTLLEKIFQFQCIYGNSPLELITEKKGREYVDLDIIDPKRFDYARTSNFNIAFDQFGNPMGYIQTMPPLVHMVNKIEPPQGVHLMGNQIYFPPERVANFKLFTVGDGLYPIGLIETIYNTYIRHKKTEEGFANAAYRLGFQILEGVVGDDKMPATEDQLQKATEELTEINSKSVFVHNHRTKLNVIESKFSDRLKTFLDYWIEQEVTGMGFPKAFSTGAGEATNRATLARQEYMAKLTLRDIVNRTVRTMESKVFFRIAEAHNKAHPNRKRIRPVKLVWGELALEELDSKAKRLAQYAQSRLLTPYPELEEYIRQIENLPEGEIPKREEKKEEGAVNGAGTGDKGE